MNDKELNVESLNLVRNRTCEKKHVRSELDTDQEGITQKLKFAAKHLNDRTQLHTSGVSNELVSYPPLLNMIKH